MPKLTANPAGPVLKEGSKLELVCEINSIDEKTKEALIFYKDDKEIARKQLEQPANKEAKLPIEAVKLSDAGKYTCKGINPRGVSVDSHAITFTVGKFIYDYFLVLFFLLHVLREVLFYYICLYRS